MEGEDSPGWKSGQVREWREDSSAFEENRVDMMIGKLRKDEKSQDNVFTQKNILIGGLLEESLKNGRSRNWGDVWPRKP